MPEPVLLTGASGFVGRAVLAELVARGIPVHAVSRRPGPAMAGVVWHQANLLTLEGRMHVASLAPRLLHCAWEVEHGSFWTSPANTLWHHASLDLVRRFRVSGGRRILALGTCAEYDPQDPCPWTEDRPILPLTPYGQARAALWRDLSDLCGDDLIWARLFHLFGPGEDIRRFAPSLIVRLRAGETVEVHAAPLIRDYASTAHAARCLAALLEADCTGAIDIGSGSSMTLGDLAYVIATEIGGLERLVLTDSGVGDQPPRMAPVLSKLFECVRILPEDVPLSLRSYARTL